MKKALSLVASLALMAGMVAGCKNGETGPSPSVTTSAASSPASVTPTDSATPSESVTPSTTVSPSGTPSSSTTLSEEEKKVFWEADKQFRAYFAEMLKLEAAGGAKKLPPVFDKYVEEPFKSELAKVMAEINEDGGKLANPQDVKLIYVARNKAKLPEGAAVVLVACVDSTKARVVGGTLDQPTGHIQHVLQYKRSNDGLMKIFKGSVTEVKQCAS